MAEQQQGGGAVEEVRLDNQRGRHLAAVHQSTRRAVWVAYLEAARVVTHSGNTSPDAVQACARAVGAFDAASAVREACGLQPLESAMVWQAATQRVRERRARRSG